jgi:hypothetical protein
VRIDEVDAGDHAGEIKGLGAIELTEAVMRVHRSRCRKRGGYCDCERWFPHFCQSLDLR